MAGHYRDCWVCAKVLPDPQRPCSNCGGIRQVPICPDVGETVVYRRPLTDSEKELIETKQIRYSDDLIPVEYPLIVVRSDLVKQGSDLPSAWVSGWLLLPGDPLLHGAIPGRPSDTEWDRRARLMPGLGVFYSHVHQTPFRWVSEIRGPSGDPGSWRWNRDRGGK